MTLGIHTHNDAGAGGRQLHRRGAGRRAPRPGHHQRLRRALRQRQHGRILANLALKTELPLLPVGGGELAGLTSLSRGVAEIANVDPSEYQPFVGRSAFAHKGGVHGAAVAKVERSYQHVDPTLVGNESAPGRVGAGRPRQHRASGPSSWGTAWRAWWTRRRCRS